jgi:hypothetical protein
MAGVSVSSLYSAFTRNRTTTYLLFTHFVLNEIKNPDYKSIIFRIFSNVIVFNFTLMYAFTLHLAILGTTYFLISSILVLSFATTRVLGLP